MVEINSPRNHRDGTSSFRLLFFALRHVVLGAVFFAGVMIGRMLEKSESFYDPMPTHHDFAGTRPLAQKTPLSRPIVEGDDGWKTMNVFYGSTQQFESSLQSEQRFFSQARQDEIVLKMLRNKTNGYFVDLAANDAAFLSNSYALERHYGWKGLCIEANPTYWYNLTHARKNCDIIGAVVGQNRMDQVDFRFQMDRGGIVGEGFDNGPSWKSSSKKEYTVTLSEIFRKFHVPRVIDYLSLDVEGAEEFIMSNFPLDDYRIRILTVERPSIKLRDSLTNHGYVEIIR